MHAVCLDLFYLHWKTQAFRKRDWVLIAILCRDTSQEEIVINAIVIHICFCAIATAGYTGCFLSKTISKHIKVKNIDNVISGDIASNQGKMGKCQGRVGNSLDAREEFAKVAIGFDFYR